MVKHLSTDSKLPSGKPPSGKPPTGKPPSGKPPPGKPPSGKPPSGKPPPGNAQPKSCAKVEGKGAFGAPAAKGKPKRQRSSDDPNSSTQKAAKRARPATARPSFAVKAIEADGWVLYDDSNPSGYDTEQCEQLRRKLLLAVRTASAQGIKLCFESVGVYRKMLRLNFADEDTNEWLRQYCSSLNDVWEGARLTLKRVSELPSIKKCFLWLPEEERNGVGVLEQLGVQNNLNTSTWLLLGSKTGERTDRPGTFLTIGVPEPDVKKVREKSGCRLYYGLGTVTLQVSAPKTIEGDMQPPASTSET